MLHQKGLDWGMLVSGLPLLVLSRAANIFPVAYLVNWGELAIWFDPAKPAIMQYRRSGSVICGEQVHVYSSQAASSSCFCLFQHQVLMRTTTVSSSQLKHMQLPCCAGRKLLLPGNLQVMMAAVGLRGAVAYGLALNLPRVVSEGTVIQPGSEQEQGIPSIEVATLVLVVVSTLLFGGLTGMWFTGGAL